MKIQISHLPVGVHILTLTESAETLELEDESGIKRDVQLDIELEKQRGAIYLKSVARATAELTCDRCLSPFESGIETEFRSVHTTDKRLIGYDDEVRPLLAGQQEIDIAEDVRDALLLALPVKHLCSDSCKGLCPACGKNRNETECDCDTRPDDPRWDALRKLIE